MCCIRRFSRGSESSSYSEGPELPPMLQSSPQAPGSNRNRARPECSELVIIIDPRERCYCARGSESKIQHRRIPSRGSCSAGGRKRGSFTDEEGQQGRLRSRLQQATHSRQRTDGTGERDETVKIDQPILNARSAPEQITAVAMMVDTGAADEVMRSGKQPQAGCLTRSSSLST